MVLDLAQEELADKMAKKAEEVETATNTPNKLTRARTKVDLIQAEDRDTGSIKF